jgi:hypothetical protein
VELWPPFPDLSGVMNPAAELMSLLAEWRHLSECETTAIGNDDWTRLPDLQRRKEPLCFRITQTLEQVRSALSSQPTALAQAEKRFAASAADLVALETQNRDLIRAKRQAKQAQLDRLAATARNLRGVRRAYGGLNPQLWQSYS